MGLATWSGTMKQDRSLPILEEFQYLMLDALFVAKTPEEITANLDKLQSTGTYLRLPKYAQMAIQAYKQGAVDYRARLEGRPISVAPRPARRQAEVPEAIRSLQPDAAWSRHPNGGGWVSSTAHVDPTAFVSRASLVFENAQVRDKARLTGPVMVHDRAIVCGDAQIKNRAIIREDAVIEGKAIVQGAAVVGGRVRIGGTVRIGGEMDLQGEYALSERVSDVAPRPSLGSPLVHVPPSNRTGFPPAPQRSPARSGDVGSGSALRNQAHGRTPPR